MATSINRQISRLLKDDHPNWAKINEELVIWANARHEHTKSRLDWIQSELDKGNHEGYRIAYGQLNLAIDNEKETLLKIFGLLTDFE